MKKPWRGGLLGKLLGIHSWGAHVFGECWCQKEAVSMCFDCLMHTITLVQVTLVVEKGDCACCVNNHFGGECESQTK